MNSPNAKKRKTVNELLAHVLAQNPRPRIADVQSILAADGIDVDPAVCVEVARRAKDSEAKALDSLISHLAATLPKNPKKREIELAAERSGYPLITSQNYRVVRARLGAIESLWDEAAESPRMHVTLTTTEALVVDRIAGMCDIPNGAVMLFALKALVIAADNGSINLQSLFSEANRISSAELDSASRVFERLNLKGFK